MKLDQKRKRIFIISVSVVLLVTIFLILVYLFSIRPAEEAIKEAREALEGEILAHETYTVQIGQRGDRAFNVYSAVADFTDAAFYNNEIYVSSGGGLVRINAGSEAYDAKRSPDRGGSWTIDTAQLRNSIQREDFPKRDIIGSINIDNVLYISDIYTTAHGLGENQITGLLVWSGMLVMAHPRSGISILNGDRIVNFSFREKRYNRISAACTGDAGVFFITDSGDLIEHDGEEFRLMKRSLFKEEKKVTTAYSFFGRIYIGTNQGGLYAYENGICKSVCEGKFKNKRINEIKHLDESLLVVTDNGLYSLSLDDTVDLISEELPISTIVLTDDKRIIIGDYFSSLYNLDRKKSRRIIGFGEKAGPVSFILSLGDFVDKTLSGSIIIGLQKDILRFSSDKTCSKLSADHLSGELSDNFITSIANDNLGRKWIGYFEGGIDIISSDWSSIRHIENDDIRVIRYLNYNMDRGEMYAASSRGVLIFDQDLNYRKITVANGLISNEVSHINFTEEGTIYCTAGGITMDRGGLLRSLYVFHNLCNNHTYTSAYIRDQIFIGTLGGISRMEDLEVKENFRVLNSPLPNSWVTALLDDDRGNLWIGTYGGGVACINAEGSWEEMKSPFGDFEVNNNALAICDGLLFVGTLSEGVVIYDIEDKVWFNYNRGLPSMNVTAFYRDIDSIYICTDSGLYIVDWDIIKEFTGG